MLHYALSLEACRFAGACPSVTRAHDLGLAAKIAIGKMTIGSRCDGRRRATVDTSWRLGRMCARARR
jgi:hypothetical protein